MASFPFGRDTVCPSWCELPADHVSSPVEWDNWHNCVVAQFELAAIGQERTAGEKPLSVEVQVCLDEEGREYPPHIRLTLACTASSPDEEDLTPDEARKLAAALQKAADLIDGESQPKV